MVNSKGFYEDWLCSEFIKSISVDLPVDLISYTREKINKKLENDRKKYR